MANLVGVGIPELVSMGVLSSDAAAIEFFRTHGLLARQLNCPTCDVPCAEKPRDWVDQIAWRCPVRNNPFLVKARNLHIS